MFCSAARLRLVMPTMPTVLLSDLFDVITLDDCQSLFECVEQNVATWKEDLFFTPVKNHILRICNGEIDHIMYFIVILPLIISCIS